ncbi:DUF4367 domain-containing protein [Methanolobus sp. WCC4]|uniref:DUF4367 domain-containing protein n=1 Tax=Methanolobus sp. WCC4 TaxID=3125784 RepID=UPI0030FA3BDE
MQSLYVGKEVKGGIFPPKDCRITFEQAQEITNNSILVPSYLPDGYKMQSACLVNGTSDHPDFTGYSQLIYTNENSSFSVTEDFSGTKEFTFEAPASDDDVEVEKITIGGHEGELRTIRDEVMRINWYIDGISVSVSSHFLEKNELIRIAESVK